MPNGTGKTTTMNLLRAAFSGRPLNAETIRSLKADDIVGDGYFEMSLVVDDSPWRVEMEFDFRREQCRFFTTSPAEQSGGRRTGHSMPGILGDTLRRGLTELFIFNGELAAEIIELGQNRADAAIRSLYQLDRLSDLKDEIKQLARKRQARAGATSAASKQAIKRFATDVEEAETTLEELEAKERTLTKQIRGCDERIKDIKEQIADKEEQSNEYADQMREVNAEIGSLEDLVARLGSSALQTFRVPPLLHAVLRERLASLGGRLSKLRLPRTMSEEFFLQLAEAADCICDRPLGPTEQAAIKRNATDFLGQDEVAVINQMKLALRDTSDMPVRFEELAEQLRAAQQDLQSQEQRKRRLHVQMSEAGTEDFTDLQNERDKLTRARERAADALYQLTHVDGSPGSLNWRANIPLCRIELKDRERKHETATGTHDFMQRTGHLRNLVSAVERESLRRLRRKIQTDTNATLETILPNEQLRISAIDGSLRLETPEVAEKTGVSEGQKLAVAYAFLTSLLARAPYELPFVVDSPAVSLDVEIRRTVAQFIPDLFEQMVMFVISSERDGFADGFYDRQDARFLTVALSHAGGETELREGIDAFRAFQSLEETRL